MAWGSSDAVDIEIGAYSVTVESWVHSGPVNVRLHGVPFQELLKEVERIKEELRAGEEAYEE